MWCSERELANISQCYCYFVRVILPFGKLWRMLQECFPSLVTILSMSLVFSTIVATPRPSYTSKQPQEGYSTHSWELLNLSLFFTFFYSGREKRSSYCFLLWWKDSGLCSPKLCNQGHKIPGRAWEYETLRGHLYKHVFRLPFLSRCHPSLHTGSQVWN